MKESEIYKSKGLKMFIVRKYIMAKSCQDALRKERKSPADDVYIADDWKEKKLERLESAIGFITDTEDD